MYQDRSRFRITPALRILITMFLLAAGDMLASPVLGYVRDHVINGLLDEAQLAHHAVDWKEGFLLPLLLIFHILYAVVLAYVAVLRNPNDLKVRQHILWGAILSLPAIFIAFVFDEFLYMQIPW